MLKKAFLLCILGSFLLSSNNFADTAKKTKKMHQVKKSVHVKKATTPNSEVHENKNRCVDCIYPPINQFDSLPVLEAPLSTTPTEKMISKQPHAFTIRPVVALSAGLNFVNNQSQALSVPYITNFYYNYNWSGSVANPQPFGGLFLGLEMPLIQNKKFPLNWQTGVSYYLPFEPYTVNGTHPVAINNIMFNSFPYSYDIFSQQLLWDNKFLTTVSSFYHPYLSLGFGVAQNRVSHYQAEINNEIPLSIADGTSNAFSYQLGAGIDVDLKMIPHLDNWRLGLGYRYASMGQASFGQINQGSSRFKVPNSTLKPNLITQEVVLQISYMFDPL
jgi:hypothetical protein